MNDVIGEWNLLQNSREVVSGKMVRTGVLRNPCHAAYQVFTYGLESAGWEARGDLVWHLNKWGSVLLFIQGVEGAQRLTEKLLIVETSSTP
ncbi:MAG: hypothetical protein HXX11_06865 [Desulfuromonadales bacterium]|nr:hypothetical protein [Desulfuromonadales bacterium]